MRPIGVTILAVWYALSGVLFLLGGLSAVTTFTISSTILTPESHETFYAELVSKLMEVVGAVLIVAGLFLLIVAYGLWNMKGWARVLVIVISSISLVIGLIRIVNGLIPAFVDITISVVVIWYMTRREVRMAFEQK